MLRAICKESKQKNKHSYLLGHGHNWPAPGQDNWSHCTPTRGKKRKTEGEGGFGGAPWPGGGLWAGEAELDMAARSGGWQAGSAPSAQPFCLSYFSLSVLLLSYRHIWTEKDVAQTNLSSVLPLSWEQTSKWRRWNLWRAASTSPACGRQGAWSGTAPGPAAGPVAEHLRPCSGGDQTHSLSPWRWSVSLWNDR